MILRLTLESPGLKVEEELRTAKITMKQLDSAVRRFKRLYRQTIETKS